MSRDSIVHEGRLRHSVPMHRALIRDARLSWGARGIFIFLWDLPSGWRPNVAHLVGMGRAKRDAVRTLMQELEALGALRLEQIREGGSGKMGGTRWVIVSPELWAREAPLRGGEASMEGEG